MTDQVRVRLMWKMAIYYGVCFAVVILAWLNWPEWFSYLPFNGLDALRDDPTILDAEILKEQFELVKRSPSLLDDAANLISAMAGALIVMVPFRWVYMTKDLAKSRNAEVASGLLVLPLVVTAIVYIVKFSLPLAFALAGIFAGVRYRTTLKSQSDAFFTFACIAVGLAAGTRALGIALVLAVFFTFTILAEPPMRQDPDR